MYKIKNRIIILIRALLYWDHFIFILVLHISAKNPTVEDVISK